MNQASSQAPPQQSDDSNTQHGRIVVVDDDELFLESLGQNLIDMQFDVRAFESGEAALAHLLAARDDDLVLLDWKMPGMNGIEVLRRMREAELEVPVIFLTVLGDQIFEEAALQGGAVDFIEKSRSFAILLKRIRLILDGAKGGRGSDPEAEAQAAGPTFRRGGLELRRDSSRAFWNGAEIPLSITEFRMVDLLATRAGQDIRYRDLYNLVHGDGFVAGYGPEGFRSNVRAFIKRIREKFRQADKDWEAIENYSGFGYRWRESENGHS